MPLLIIFCTVHWKIQIESAHGKHNFCFACIQILSTTTEISATVVDSSLSSLSNIVNKSNTASKNAGVLHNDIVQSVDIISQIASKNVTFSDHETANKTTQV